MIFITKLINYNNYNSFSGCDVVVSAQMAPINGKTQMGIHVLGSLQTISYSTHQDRAPVRSIGNINAIDYVQGQRTIAGTMVFAMFHEHWMTPLLEELADHVPNTDIWSDELPALNLTISMANEYGYKSNMVLYGVKFIDDGGVMSINDLYTENTLQYVATGIQPLKTSGQHEHSYLPNIYPFHISEVEETPRKIWEFIPDSYTKTWPDFGEIIIEVDKTTPPTVYPFFLTATINPPVVPHLINWDNPEDTRHTMYVLEIKAEVYEPKDRIIEIFLTNSDTPHQTHKPELGDEESPPHETYEPEIYDTIHNPATNKWVTEIPEGYYSVGIKTEHGTIFDDIWEIEISLDNNQDNVIVLNKSDKDKDEINKNGAAPSIRGIKDTYVSLTPNTQADMIEIKRIEPANDGSYEYMETGEYRMLNVYADLPVGSSNGSEVIIDGLSPDSLYRINIVSTKEGIKSDPVIVKTFDRSDYINNLLNFYISSNADLLVDSRLISFDFSSLKNEYDNIIDALINVEAGEEKAELVLYGIILQNKILNVFNDHGIGVNNETSASNILNNLYSISDKIRDVVLYKKKDTKNYFISKGENNGEFSYNGSTNTHYYIQPVLKSGDKFSCIDFACFDQEHRDKLDRYMHAIDLNNLSIINNNHIYKSYNYELKSAIKASENLPLYQNILEEPHASLYNDTVVVNVDYREKHLNSEENTLYLCIATPEEAVSHTPIIKKVVKEGVMIFDKFELLILKDSYYLLWIQDAEFNNISPAFIFSTYQNDTEMQDYYSNKNESKLKSMASLFPVGTTYRTYINAAIDVVLSEINVSYKDLELLVLQALLLLYEDHLISRTLDDVIQNVVTAYYSNGAISCKFIRDDNVISYSCKNDYVSIACINITQSNIERRSFSDAYDMNICTEGYTLLYLIDNRYNTTSNVMLINNVTKEILSSNINLEVMK